MPTTWGWRVAVIAIVLVVFGNAAGIAAGPNVVTVSWAAIAQSAGTVHRPTVANYRQDRLVSLLSHAHLPHARERDKSAEVAVTHQPKAFWDLSAELAHEIGSGVGIRTLNLAVNRSAQPV